VSGNVNEMPFGAYEGGAKVLNAIREVINGGGSIDRALKAGNDALMDLRPRLPDPGIPIYRHPDGTDEVLGEKGKQR